MRKKNEKELTKEKRRVEKGRERYHKYGIHALLDGKRLEIKRISVPKSKKKKITKNKIENIK